MDILWMGLRQMALAFGFGGGIGICFGGTQCTGCWGQPCFGDDLNVDFNLDIHMFSERMNLNRHHSRKLASKIESGTACNNVSAFFFFFFLSFLCAFLRLCAFCPSRFRSFFVLGHDRFCGIAKSAGLARVISHGGPTRGIGSAATGLVGFH